MKKKWVIFLIIGIALIILSFSIIQMIRILFTIIFSTHTLFCNNQDIVQIGNQYNYHLAVYTEGIRGNEKTARVINFYGKEIIIEKNSERTIGPICEYIKQHDNSNYALIICETPYFIVCIICVILISKSILKINNINNN